MTRQRHYHPLAALRFLRKAVVVCLLPLANALLEFSLNALLTALRQDAALLLFLCGASSILLEASSWALDEAGVLRLRWAFISKRERIIRGEALAALTIERPLFFRLLGASRVVLYPVGQPAKRAVALYLHKENAQELADRLMPVRDPVCHRPAGGERAALVVLGANGLSTLALTYLAIRQSRPFPLTAEAVALSRLNVLVRFAAHWLPAGAAWMLVLTGALFGISLARSFVQTVHYTVWHTADQLGSRGGRLTVFSQRSPRAVRAVLGGLRLAAPALTCGGTLAYRFSEGSGQPLCSFAGCEESIFKKLPAAVGLGIALQMADGSTRVLRMSTALERHLRREFTPFTLCSPADVKGEDVLRILLYQDRQQLPIQALLEKALGDNAAMLRSERTGMDVMVLTPGAVSAEAMLGAVCLPVNCTADQLTVAAGCSQMLELVRQAKQSVVPADAPVELRLAASQTTLTDHDTGAAAEFFYGLVRSAEAAS